MPEPDTTPAATDIAADLIARCPEHGYSTEAWPECRCAAAREAAAWLAANPEPLPAVGLRGQIAAAIDTVTGGTCPTDVIDAVLAVRDQEMEALRAELVATVANLNRADEDGARAEVAERRAQAVARTAREEIRRRREAEDTLDRVRNVAVELELFAEAALKVPDRELYATIAKSLRTALTPPADQDRGGQ